MNLFDCKGKTALMEKTRKELEFHETAIAVYRAVVFYCSETNSKVSPFTKRELLGIVDEVAETRRRDKVSLGRALSEYRSAHLNDPRSDIFNPNKVKDWKEKVRARSLSGSCSSDASVKSGDVA